MSAVTRTLVAGASLVAALAVAATTPLTAQQRPDRSKPPVTGPAPELKLPPIQRFTLGNGLRVVLRCALTGGPPGPIATAPSSS